MPNGFVNSGLGIAGITNFFFSTPITLTPGQTYYLQPVVLSGDDPWDIIVLTDDAYSNGQLFSNGLPGATIDFWFREGIVSVPEPSTLALIGVSCFLVYIFKRRCKLIVPLLFAASVLSVHATPDSVVQATADEAGLTPVSSASLPDSGTFWIMTNSPDDNLMALPFPFLPSSLSDLPIYAVTNNEFIVDDTGGQLAPASAGRMSTAQATAIAQTQAATMAVLIQQMLYPANEEYQPNGFTPMMIDPNGLWLEASNEAPNLGLRLHNPASGDNYQLLSTTNLSNTNWDLGQILPSAYGSYMDFTPVPITNATTFFRVHHANPVMVIVDIGDSKEPNPANNDPGYSGGFYIADQGRHTNDVTVYYSIGGTAQNGIDYSNLTGMVTISPNQSYAEVDINPIADGLKPNQTVILTLLQNTNYLLDPAYYSATNNLIANPQVYPIAFGDNEAPCPNSTNNITLTAFAQSGLPLTFSILTYPAHGTLTYVTNENYGSEVTNVTYVPNSCYEGQDSFTFTASDGQYTSTPATVTLTIANQLYANPVTALVFGTNPASFTLSGGDYGCGEAYYAPLFQPAHGTVTNVSGLSTDPNYIYLPAGANFSGTDTFNYIVADVGDDCGDAATSTVTLQFVDGPVLFPDCNPFSIVSQLDWALDANDQQENLNLEDFIVYRSAVSGGPYTAIATNSPGQMNYLDTNAPVGQTNYYIVTFESYDYATGITHESPVSNEIAVSGQNPNDLIPANAVWDVTDISDTNHPVHLGNLQAPFSSYGTNQYPNLDPLPNTYWPPTTNAVDSTWTNHIALYIPTNAVLSQVQYAIAIDNVYWLYVNGVYIDTRNNNNMYAVWSSFKAFNDVAPNLLHYGTNDIGVVIQDWGDVDYFSMVVATNICGQ